MPLLRLFCFTLLALLGCPASRAQGTVWFANRDARAGIDAPIYYPGGVTLFQPPLVLEVFAGRDPSNLAPVPINLYLSLEGYWTPQIYTFNNFNPGDTAYIQVRAFMAGAGDYDQVVARGGYHGTFDVLPIVLGGDTGGGTHPPTLPASLTGLRPLVLTGIPEPSVLKLLVLAMITAGLTKRWSTTSPPLKPLSRTRR